MFIILSILGSHRYLAGVFGSVCVCVCSWVVFAFLFVWTFWKVVVFLRRYFHVFCPQNLDLLEKP